MPEYTPEEVEAAKEEVRKMSEKTRSEPPYTGKAYSDTGPKPGVKQGGFGGSSGGGGDFGSGLQKMNKDLKRNLKSGGKITASTRGDGCCQRGKTKGRMV